VKPIYSDQERGIAVRNFIDARYQGLAKIGSFNPIVPYLSGQRLKLLQEIGQSGYIHAMGERVGTRYPTEDDAERYFNWLVSVVTGAEKAGEEIVKQANDQLFIFIHALRDTTVIDKTVQIVKSHDWENRLESFESKLNDIRNTIDRRDKEITETLSSILVWMKKYNPILNAVDEDYKNQLGKVKRK
jgi:hypothetical protein